MKDWHALWLHWTHPAGVSAAAAGSSEPGQPSVVESWVTAGQQWWSWWLAAAATPWLRQPWPHAGELEAPVPQGATPPPARTLPPPQRTLPPAHGHVPDSRKAPNKRLEAHKGRQLQRRKVNPGG